jgi:hypothetical protein
MPEFATTLVLSDGGMLGLLGATRAREEAIIAGVDAARLPSTVMLLGFGGSATAEQRQLGVLAQARVLGVGVWGNAAIATVESHAREHEREVLELLAASLAASRQGVQRVVWCVGAGTKDSVDVDRLGQVASCAIAVARLVILSSESGNARDFRIETPVADLSDAQAAELAADMDVELRACWWSDLATSDEYRRWRPALQAAGWRTTQPAD